MTEIANENEVPGQGEELDDFDVEGHGLKEIALGLSAATIVAGGAGATALALDNPIPGTTAGIQAVVSGAEGDVEEQRAWALKVADSTLDSTVKHAASTVEDVRQLSQRTTTVVTTAVTPVTYAAEATVAHASEVAGQAVDDATRLAQQAISDPVGTTDRLVDESLVTVRATRDGALTTAKDAVALADRTATGAVTTTKGVATDATQLAQSTVGQVQQTVGLQAEVESGEEGTQARAGAAGTTVTVSTG